MDLELVPHFEQFVAALGSRALSVERLALAMHDPD
jgi:hypothetical protein